MNTRASGITGEVLAKNYIIKKGYVILETNFSTKLGEIDIIATKPGFFLKLISKTDINSVRNNKLPVYFIEVKFRDNFKFGLPREAVTLAKQNKIRRVAELYIKKHQLYDNDINLDVIEIIGDRINHIQQAF